MKLIQVRNLADSLKNIPDYAEELIPGILRQGHKMLLVGPSKSGKSFALIELCIAITEGTEWIGRKCKRINGFLSDASAGFPVAKGSHL